MNTYSQWQDSEVKKLFDCIEKAKDNNKSLLEGFRYYAKKMKRKPNSVRNYYYLEVENLKKDISRAKRLGIDLSKHEVQKPDKFSEEETENLVTEILRMKCLGYSVRRACLKIANNSAEEMLRYQNKFRSVVKNNNTLYNKCLATLRKEGLTKKIYPSNKGNVVYLKKPEDKKLTDDDVNSLFLGLVKLVKKTAIESLEKDFISEVEFANSTLRQTLVKVSTLEKVLETKNKELDVEKNKNQQTLEENISLKAQIATLINKKTQPNKNKSLSKYLQEIKEKGVQIKTKMNN